MPKQHLEKFLSKELKNLNLWYLKLQVMPLSFHTSPADYIVLTHTNRYLIECKETKSNRFVFDRLTQEADLINFHNRPNNYAYVMLLFWQNRMSKSTLFLISINRYLEFKAHIPKKSANLDDFLAYFKPIQLNEIKNVLI